MTGLATRIARRLADEWMCFWFEPVPASNLAISRLTFFGLLWLLYVPYDFRGWADVSPALFEPIWLFENERVPDLTSSMPRPSSACSCLGVLSRVSMPIAAVLGLYLLGLPHNFGQTYHFDAMIVIAIGILACSRAGDALSIDQAMRRWRGP